MNDPSHPEFAAELKGLALALGFDEVGIAGIDLADDEARLLEWLAAGLHGELHYMERFGARRARPAAIKAGTVRVITVRLDYWPGAARPAQAVLSDPSLGYVSRYALGRDYHRLMRGRLQQLADQLGRRIGPFGYRVFVDTGPVLEKPLARNAGLGWIGKHTNLINSHAGSYFFLGELYTDLELPIDPPASAHCGSCAACIPACPTGAIIAPYRLDARRCISYLTIELKGTIPEELRAPIGNRIYGCDDCQLVCPWNKFARVTSVPGFEPRHGLDAPRLTSLFAWSASEFDAHFQGSPIRRIGHERWLRNVAVALGNAPAEPGVQQALEARADHPSALVREHVGWALAQQRRKTGAG
ncbi:MAG TPA: tRNA epoxyqueuosine(34) reductase QueG [Steroidobacteraceae bacterium]|nr:tRNA epoxyqueuosine(34) reductase QueG [Steroidobacteraceae bacterium]